MRLITLSSLFFFAAIGLGAFGAHALRESLDASGHARAWETAVQYLAYHSLALLAVGIWRQAQPAMGRRRLLHAACVCWIAGVLLFSGSLFAIALGGPRWLGPMTPIGGVSFLAGWLLLALDSWRAGRTAVNSHDAA
jgi:uncharacterized membrane protein YgdD (TMEM256/DUF423 family)